MRWPKRQSDPKDLLPDGILIGRVSDVGAFEIAIEFKTPGGERFVAAYDRAELRKIDADYCGAMVQCLFYPERSKIQTAPDYSRRRVMSDAVLELRNIRRTFNPATAPLRYVLRGCSLKVRAGEPVALIGPSGSGKSTFLHAAGLLEKPDAGEILIAGKAAQALDDDGRTELRRKTIGFVYQFHHLLPEFSALENIMLPQMIAGISNKAAKERAHELLNMVGLSAWADHRSGSFISGGEQQRVALARALANATQNFSSRMNRPEISLIRIRQCRCSKFCRT